MLFVTGRPSAQIGRKMDRLASCCIGWDFAISRPARAIRKPIPKPKRRIKNFAALIADAIPEHAKGKPIELWWEDEARVGQKGSLTYLWALKGSRPSVLRDLRYESATIFGTQRFDDHRILKVCHLAPL